MSAIKVPWPLVLFTTFASIGTGAWLASSVMDAIGVYPGGSASASLGLLLASWFFVVLSFAFSTAHLGAPLKAFASFSRVGNSNLSNEVFTGFLFVVLSGLCVVVRACGLLSTSILAVLVALSSVMAVLFCFMSCRAYRSATVPAWNALPFSLGFAVDAVLGGFCLTACGAAVLGGYETPVQHVLLAIVVGGFIVDAVLTLSQIPVAVAKVNDWMDVASKRKQFLRLNSYKIYAQGLGVALLTVAVIFRLDAILWLLSFLLVFAGIFVERWSFYTAYDCVGLPR